LGICDGQGLFRFCVGLLPFRHSFRWAAGAGIEYLFTDAISAKIEYLYVNLGSVSCPSGTLCSSDQGELNLSQINKTIPSGSVSFTENLIRVGVNYKFSW
jgi:outer membrane immunogenic protein